MVDNEHDETTPTQTAATAARSRRRAASRPAGPPVAVEGEAPQDQAAATPAADAPVTKPKAVRAPRRTKKADAEAQAAAEPAVEAPVEAAAEPEVDAPAAAPTRSRRAPIKAAFVAPVFMAPEPVAGDEEAADDDAAEPPVKKAPARRRKAKVEDEAAVEATDDDDAEASAADSDADDEGEDGQPRRRRRRGGRGRRRRGGDADGDAEGESTDDAEDTGDDADAVEGETEEQAASRRRRRRRRRGNDDLEPSPDDPPNTVVKVREPRGRGGNDDVSSMRGSTRLEAKKQRRREGREAGRRRPPILTESEFLARRESVERVMVVRQNGDRTQIAVLEDGVLVEHYVTRGSSGSLVGNVYLGRVQNVLPSMEAAFVDIGRGRNAVLYAGEVNWDAAGLDGQPKRIEFALKSGDPVLVQVTKDPVGQKGARLTSQISLPGRFLVYVPDGSMTGISRKLPDTERSRLKSILKRVLPDEAGVIVRTAAEGAPEESLVQDVERLKSQWEGITARAKGATPPTLLYGEPDLAIKVVRDIFNEDVNRMVVSGAEAWQQLEEYVTSVAPDLADRLVHHVGSSDVFTEYRVDEQLAKALDRKVWLPSGGSLVIDRTEAMTVVDVNTGKFTGKGGNLEQTVTSNNLEAAEEIVRQLRLRDIGGIIVVDFIDMVLESNRDLVLRRLVECLGRDRTKHQVAEVTSLGLVQMTRKRIGSGLIESFSTPCEVCNGRGIKVNLHEHDHLESPKHRRPANAVDPADVAARALLASDEAVDDDAAEVELDLELDADDLATEDIDVDDVDADDDVDDDAESVIEAEEAEALIAEISEIALGSVAAGDSDEVTLAVTTEE
ncbi:MAG: Rne/Rng family ribonuclease [Candidatus Nanopelagicales bacterium]|nr:Rne/Rng family ribonuclease [Candidatus Nanopelagicales bacterium]